MWVVFCQDIFDELESDCDVELEVDAAVSRYLTLGGRVRGERPEELPDLQGLQQVSASPHWWGTYSSSVPADWSGEVSSGQCKPPQVGNLKQVSASPL